MPRKFVGLGTLPPGTAHVFSADCPDAVLYNANQAKYHLGELVQICDGTADDIQIQAAIDALSLFNDSHAAPSGGGRVVLSEGRFWISAPIDIIGGHITIEGQGKSTNLYATAVIANIFNSSHATPVYGIQIRDMYMTGSGVAVNGILVDGMYDALIDNVEIISMTGSGIYGDGAVKLLEMVKVNECRCRANQGYGIYLSNSGMHVLTNNAILQNGIAGILLLQGDTCQVIGNSTDSNIGNGYSLTIVTNLTFVGNNSYNDCVSAGAGAIEIYGAFNQGLIGNNHILNSNRSGMRFQGLVGGNVTGLVVTGNIITDTDAAYYAILADGAGSIIDSIIANNDVSDNTNAISLTTAVQTRLTVKDNPGYITENSGIATLLNANTSIIVAHGCDGTPTVINISWRENPTNVIGDWWIDTIGAANFTLNGVDPGASNLDFGWEAKVR